VVPLDARREDEILALAAAAEQGSEHPLASAIVDAARHRGLTMATATAFNAHPGQGIEAQIGAERILVGNESFMQSQGLDVAANPRLVTWQREAATEKTLVLVATPQALLGLLAIADPIKPEAARAVATLKTLGLQVAMITGDHPRTAHAVARSVGIDQVFAQTLPDAKAQHIRDLQAAGQRVAMVGDGINDAPALAQADLGIAIGSGTDVAIAAADITLLRGDLALLPAAIGLSRATLRIIRQNLFWAFIYNAAGITLAMTGVLNPILAAGAMVLSSLSVIGNSLRLGRR
jgi:Cu+-exporting ATPase